MVATYQPHRTSDDGERGGSGWNVTTGTDAATATGTANSVAAAMVGASERSLELAVQLKNDPVDRPRVLTVEDLPWLHYLFRKRYDHKYSPEGTELWFRNEVLAKPILYFPVRSDDAMLISMITTLPWTPTEFTCDQIFACADTGKMWQLVGLLRRSLDWARRRHCTLWRVSSDTEYDFRPLAKRFGAIEMQPRWTIPLEPPHA